MLERRRGLSIPLIRFSNSSPVSPLLAWLISETGSTTLRPMPSCRRLVLKGDKLFDGSWGYDVGFRYSQIKNTSTGSFVSATRFNRILNANDPIFDPTSSEFIGTTVPFNPFTDYRVPFPSNFATIDFATIHPKNVDTSKLATLDATMYTTALFKLPAGGVGLAYGGQFRRESIEQNIDQLNQGDNLGETPFHSTRAGRKSYGIYAETDIPVFSAANSIPAFHALEFTAAARFEYYLNNDTNVLVPKFGMRWQPFDDSLTIRSTWGEGFREPSLYELFGSSFSEFEGPEHGCSCDDQHKSGVGLPKILAISPPGSFTRRNSFPV